MKRLIKALSLGFGLILLISFMHGENQERIIVETLFKPVIKVNPDYPEILKKEGIAARFLIGIFLERDGSVRRARVWRSQYPEMEENIEKAFEQWKFEPFIQNGEPIPIFGFLKVIFYPGKLSIPVNENESILDLFEEELVKSEDKELQRILDKCSEYCLKLSESALYYVCHERIKEKFKNLDGPAPGLSIIPPSFSSQGLVFSSASVVELILGNTDRHVYVNDYQLIRRKEIIEEKRILMEMDRKNVNIENSPQLTRQSYSIKPILVPVQILSIEKRSRFLFRQAKDEKIKGKLVYVIEAYPRPGQKVNIRRGKLWVNKSDFQIVKAEIETDFVEGYEDIISECDNFYLKPHFKSTHYYEVEKNDILFPSRSNIRVEYSGLMAAKKALKSELDVTYENYKFFIVKTDHNVIKKKMEALFLNRSKLKFNRLIRLLPEIIKHNLL